MRSRGVLKKYDSDRGFGFIKPDDGSGDVFVHARAARDSGIPTMPEVGAKVEYEIEHGDRGPRAVRLTVAALR